MGCCEGTPDTGPDISPMSPDDEKKKTDESWKEKAQREKEQLSDVPEETPELPPASFLGLIDELSLRVMLALGQIRNPKATEVYLDLDGAKYAIDTIQMLLEKTKGNLAPEEEATVKDVVHNLRLLYVHIARAAASGPPAGGDPGEAPGGEAPPEKPGPKIIL
jgi:uncharacterized protein DUF1844